MLNTNLYGVLPVLGVVIGAAIGAKVKIPETTRAVLLACAAGLITASIFIDVSPALQNTAGDRKKQIALLGGFAGGALMMLGLREYDDKKDAAHEITKRNTSVSTHEFPMTLVGATVIDFFIHSFIIGQSFAKNPAIGLAVGSTVESIVITSGIINIMKSHGNTGKQMIIASAILIAASVVGFIVGRVYGIHMSSTSTIAVMGMTTSVVLWMVVQEVYPEAMKVGQKKWWIPAVWLATTAGGFIIDWTLEEGRDKPDFSPGLLSATPPQNTFAY